MDQWINGSMEEGIKGSNDQCLNSNSFVKGQRKNYTIRSHD